MKKKGKHQLGTKRPTEKKNKWGTRSARKNDSSWPFSLYGVPASKTEFDELEVEK